MMSLYCNSEMGERNPVIVLLLALLLLYLLVHILHSLHYMVFQRLTGRGIPSWINRLAYLSSWLPLLLTCLPPSWVAPGRGEEDLSPPSLLHTTHSMYSNRTCFIAHSEWNL